MNFVGSVKEATGPVNNTLLNYSFSISAAVLVMIVMFLVFDGDGSDEDLA